MERDATTSAKLAELRQHLESISGQQIEASEEQLFHLFFRVSLSSSEDGTIMSRRASLAGRAAHRRAHLGQASSM